MTDTEKNCSNCSLHRVEKRPKVVSELFDTVVEFEDEDATVYHCTVSKKEIGFEPIYCDSYKPPKDVKQELDSWEARFLARQK